MRDFGHTGPQPKAPETATQGISVTIGDYHTYTKGQRTWIKENAKNLLFSRHSDQDFRKKFINRSLGREDRQDVGLYINFVSMTQSEKDANDWDSYIATYGDGTFVQIDRAEGLEEEYLCKFWATDWLNVRLATMPNYDSNPTLKNTNLTYLFLDLCNLYPVPLLAGTPPVMEPEAWRTSMLSALHYMRTRIDFSVKLIPNCVRAHIGVAGYVQDPESFFPYDGSDAIGQGYGNMGLTEMTMNWGAEQPEVQTLFASLRTMRRLAKAGIPVYSSWHCPEDDLAARYNGLAAFAQIYTPGLTQYGTTTGKFSNSPPRAYPENNIDFGAPASTNAGDIDPMFERSKGITPKVFAREFANGTVAIFNGTASEQSIPAPYASWRLIKLNQEVAVDDQGNWEGKIWSARLPPQTKMLPFTGALLAKPN